MRNPTLKKNLCTFAPKCAALPIKIERVGSKATDHQSFLYSAECSERSPIQNSRISKRVEKSVKSRCFWIWGLFTEDAYEQSYATLKFTKHHATITIREYARGAGQCSCRMTDAPPAAHLLTSPSQ